MKTNWNFNSLITLSTFNEPTLLRLLIWDNNSSINIIVGHI